MQHFIYVECTSSRLASISTTVKLTRLESSPSHFKQHYARWPGPPSRTNKTPWRLFRNIWRTLPLSFVCCEDPNTRKTLLSMTARFSVLSLEAKRWAAGALPGDGSCHLNVNQYWKQSANCRPHVKGAHMIPRLSVPHWMNRGLQGHGGRRSSNRVCQPWGMQEQGKLHEPRSS